MACFFFFLDDLFPVGCVNVLSLRVPPLYMFLVYNTFAPFVSISNWSSESSVLIASDLLTYSQDMYETSCLSLLNEAGSIICQVVIV